jgi:ribonuclease HI
MFTVHYKTVQKRLEPLQAYGPILLQDIYLDFELHLTSLSAARRTLPHKNSVNESNKPPAEMPPLPSLDIIHENAVIGISKEELEWAQIKRDVSRLLENQSIPSMRLKQQGLPSPMEQNSNSSSLVVELEQKPKINNRKRKRSSSPEVPRSHRCQGLSSQTYQGPIVIKDRAEAKQFAMTIHALPYKTEIVRRIVLWTDGSIIQRCGAGSVVWKKEPSKSWGSKGFPLPYATDNSNLVELFAIAHALDVAVDQVKDLKELASKAFCIEEHDFQIQPEYYVFVFTDCSAALWLIRNGSSWRTADRSYCDDYILKCVGHYDALRQLGATVQLHFVPGHKGVPGNEEADRVARVTARSLACEMALGNSGIARRVDKALGSFRKTTGRRISRRTRLLHRTMYAPTLAPLVGHREADEWVDHADDIEDPGLGELESAFC